MSKESKSRDRWRQSGQGVVDRPANWCKSCGYNPVVDNGRHADSCMIAHPRPRGTPPPTWSQGSK